MAVAVGGVREWVSAGIGGAGCSGVAEIYSCSRGYREPKVQGSCPS